MSVYNSKKIIAIVGPTSSGKSELAVKLAKKYRGEIISCDSRQIYKGMDLGTGKIPGKRIIPPLLFPSYAVWRIRRGEMKRRGGKQKYFVYKDIIHHLIDFVDPKKQYSVTLFQKEAQKIIRQILRRRHIPILCGGTGFWIDALIFNQQIPNVKPDLVLRKKLEKKSSADLYKRLQKLDYARAKTIDRNNKRRLIRALEIVIATGKPVPPRPLLPWQACLSDRQGEMSRACLPDRQVHPSDREVESQKYDVLWLGIKLPKKELYKKIDKRLQQRLKTGMIKEVSRLHSPPKIGGVSRAKARDGVVSPPKIGGVSQRMLRRGGMEKGLSWRRLQSFGLEYRYISLYLQKKLTYQEMTSQLSRAIKHYAKRQKTWFKRNKQIHWIKNLAKAKQLTQNFLERI